MSWPYFGYCERCNSTENKPHKPVNGCPKDNPKCWEWICTKCIESFDKPLTGASAITYLENPNT